MVQVGAMVSEVVPCPQCILRCTHDSCSFELRGREMLLGGLDVPSHPNHVTSRMALPSVPSCTTSLRRMVATDKSNYLGSQGSARSCWYAAMYVCRCYVTGCWVLAAQRSWDWDYICNPELDNRDNDVVQERAVPRDGGGRWQSGAFQHSGEP